MPLFRPSEFNGVQNLTNVKHNPVEMRRSSKPAETNKESIKGDSESKQPFSMAESDRSMFTGGISNEKEFR